MKLTLTAPHWAKYYGMYGICPVWFGTCMHPHAPQHWLLWPVYGLVHLYYKAKWVFARIASGGNAYMINRICDIHGEVKFSGEGNG